MKNLYVRVRPKSGQTTFFRCAIQFSLAWLFLRDVDAATAKRLEAEQMLEVSETKPADFEEPTPNAADPAGTSTAAVSGTPAAAPADPAERLAAIKAAVAQLDTSEPANFTAANKPKTEAIAAITGWPVTAAERDFVLVEALKEEQ